MIGMVCIPDALAIPRSGITIFILVQAGHFFLKLKQYSWLPTGVESVGMPSSAKYNLFLILATLLLVSPCNSMGKELCEIPTMRIDQRPDHTGPPTEVTMGILVADIVDIDDVAQTITGDFIVVHTWVDNRLAEAVGCRVQVSKVWNPRIESLNSVVAEAKRKFAKDQVEIEEGGRVRYYQRWYGSIATYHHLAKFPFDPQNFRLRFTSIDYDLQDIVLKADKQFTRVADLINIPDWTIGKASVSVEKINMVELGAPRSVLVLEIPAVRNTNFYIWKVLVPLGLIVMMSWGVFWINPVQFGPQIGLPATSMLTLIAFQFALTGVLPKLSYFTTMDKLIFGSTVLVFMSLIEAVVTISLVSRGMDKWAVQLDAVCRWFFPILFVVYWVAVMLLDHSS